MGASILASLDVTLEVREGMLHVTPLRDEAIQHPCISLIAPKDVGYSPTTAPVIETPRKGMPSGEFQA